jgi:predicted GIY-YIG superfamily endonuclease
MLGPAYAQRKALLRLHHGPQRTRTLCRCHRIPIPARNAAQAGEIDGFTKQYHVTRHVYYESFQYIDRAIARETEIKKWRREKKIALIEWFNPAWADLAEDWGARISLKRADSSPAKAGSE